MKATIDIPDDLYRKVKTKSALLGKSVRQVTVELYRHWIDGGTAPAAAEDWLEAFRMLQVPLGTPGPTAREILEEGRKRLEPRP